MIYTCAKGSLFLFGNRWMNKMALASLGDLNLDKNVKSEAGLLKPDLRQGEHFQTNSVITSFYQLLLCGP